MIHPFTRLRYYYICIAQSVRCTNCGCVFSSHLFWASRLLDVPAGVTQEEGHTGFLIHLPSAVLALIFLARRIQPSLSLVGREVEFCVLTIQSFSTSWAFLFYLLFLSDEKSQLPGFESTSQRVRRFRGYQLSYRGDRLMSEERRSLVGPWGKRNRKHSLLKRR